MLAVVTVACHADGAAEVARPVDSQAQAMASPAVQTRAAQPPPAKSVAPKSKCEPLTELDVLFIGNSYLNHHHLPQRLAQMGDDAGIRIGVDKVTMGGESFEYHVTHRKTGKLLRARDWDVVVLQSHSLDPLRNAEGFALAGAALGAKARAIGAEPVLFETWARRAGHNLYNYFEPTGGSPRAMQAKVSAAYAALGKGESMRVAPVGRAWLRAIQEHPEIDLFVKDGGHPGPAGAYLGACVVFSLLTDRAVVGGAEASEGLGEAEAVKLRQVAADIVQPHC